MKYGYARVSSLVQLKGNSLEEQLLQADVLPENIVEKPNETTEAAIKEGNRIATNKEIKGVHSLDELKKDLGLEVD